MKKILALFAVLSLSAAPAFAGGIAFDFPHITYPPVATPVVTQDCTLPAASPVTESPCVAEAAR